MTMHLWFIIFSYIEIWVHDLSCRLWLPSSVTTLRVVTFDGNFTVLGVGWFELHNSLNQTVALVLCNFFCVSLWVCVKHLPVRHLPILKNSWPFTYDSHNKSLDEFWYMHYIFVLDALLIWVLYNTGNIDIKSASYGVKWLL